MYLVTRFSVYSLEFFITHYVLFDCECVRPPGERRHIATQEKHFSFKKIVRGHHIYKHDWTPRIGKWLGLLAGVGLCTACMQCALSLLTLLPSINCENTPTCMKLQMYALFA